MSDTRIRDRVLCNPLVKLEKGVSYPFIDMEAITPGIKAVGSVESSEYSGQSCSKFCSGDTLMARITPCLENGKIAQYTGGIGKAFGSTEFFVFRGIPKITDNDYIYYLMSTSYIRKSAVNSMTGASGRQRADITFISKIKWNFPSYQEQKRIARILSAYDKLIEINNKRIKVLEQMAENLYKEWFVRFRFPGHESVPFENGLPKGWQIRRISEISSIKAGGDRPSAFSENPADGMIVPIFSNGIENDGLYGFTDIPQISNESITISARGTVGYICLRRVPYVPIVRLIAIVPDASIVTALYLYYYLQSDSIIANGTSQQQITIPMVSRKRVLVPPEALLKRFDSIESPIWSERDKLKEQNRKLSKQRDLLLPRLMSGKLEV